MAALISAFLIMVLIIVLSSSPPFIVGATHFEPRVNNKGHKYNHNLELKLVSEIKRSNNKMEENFFKIKTLYDPNINKHVHLFNPIIMRLQMTPIILAYPLKFTHLVNNRPYNLILGNQHECRAPGMTTICGKRRGHSKNQGFCCPHVLEAHCFMYDPVWYSVNTIARPLMIQILGIQIYEEQFSFSTRNSQWKLIAEASTLLTSGKSPSKLASEENHYLSAKMLNMTKVGNNTCKSCLDFESNYLLIPTAASPLKKGTPQYDQVNGGVSQFLVVNRNLMDFEGRTCGAVGVTEEAFLTNKFQCAESFVEECLQNQPMDLWFHDIISTSRELKLFNKTKYFLSKYVKLFSPYATFIPSCSNDILLLVESLQSDMTVKMEVNLLLEKNIEFQKSATVLTSVGIIGTIYSCPLVDGSKEHEIGINIYNAGILSGKYNLLLKCNIEEQSKTIILAPYESQTVLFYQKTTFVVLPDEILGTQHSGNFISDEKPKFTPFIRCRLKLWSNEEKTESFKTFFLEEKNICICLEGCKCTCGPEYKCEPLEQERPLSHPIVKVSAGIILAEIFAFILALNLIKVFLGLFFPKQIGEVGLCLFIQGQWLNKYFEDDLKYKYVQYDEKGYPIDPDTGRRVRGLSHLKMSLINLLFFFYLPIVGLHWIWKIKKTKKREVKGKKVKENYEVEDVLSLTSLCDSDDGHHVTKDISKYVNEGTTLLDNVKSKPEQKYYVSTFKVNVNKYNDTNLTVNKRKEVCTTAGKQKEVNSITGKQTEVYLTTDKQKEVDPTAGKQKEMSPNAGIQKEMFPTSGNQNEMSPTVDKQNEMFLTTGKQYEMSPTTDKQKDIISKRNEISPTTGKQNEIFPTTGKQKEMFPTTGKQKEISPTTGNQRVVDTSDDEDNTLDLSISTKERSLNINTSNNLVEVGTRSDLENIDFSDDDRHKNMSKLLNVLRKEQEYNIQKNLIPEREGFYQYDQRQPLLTDKYPNIKIEEDNYETDYQKLLNEKKKPHGNTVRFSHPEFEDSHKSIENRKEGNTDVNSDSAPTNVKGGFYSSVHCSGNEEQTLARILNSNPVYYNHQSFSPFLRNSGECFSLCGNIEKRENSYIFRLGSFLKQTYEIVEDSVRILESKQILITQAHKFVKIMDAEDVLQCITEKPKYPCLNLPNYIFINDH